MRFALKSTLPAAFLFALMSSYGGSSEENITPIRIKYVTERDGTRVFKWDPPGAEPRHVKVLDFYVKASNEFQKLDVDLRPGDVAIVEVTGCWAFGEGKKFSWADAGGFGIPADASFIEPGASEGALLMDAHLNKYSDRYIFASAKVPIAVHGPCTSLTFVANQPVGYADHSKGDFKGGGFSSEQKGRLHVHIEMPDHGSDNGFTKDK